MSQHTNGPWKHDEVWQLIKGSNGEEIAAIHTGQADDVKRTDRNIAAANARLIAAAPELLEALQAVNDWSDLPAKSRRSDFVEMMNKVMKAIAKAEGRA